MLFGQSGISYFSHNVYFFMIPTYRDDYYFNIVIRRSDVFEIMLILYEFCNAVVIIIEILYFKNDGLDFM